MISNGKNYYEDFEILLPLFMDVTNDLFIVVRSEDEFKMEFINSSSFLDKLGYSHDSLVGTPFLALFYSDDAKKIINLLKNNSLNKKQSEEMRIKTSLHDTYWVEITLKKFRSKFTDNKVLINLKDISKRKDLESKLSAAKLKNKQSIDHDITESKLTEQKLRESEEKFRTLFELTPASTVVSDAEGKIILYNQKFCKLHGVKNPELLKGKAVLEFFAKKDWPKLAESIKKTAEGTLLGTIEYTMIKEDGTQFQAEANSSGIRDEDGKIVNLIGVAQDITERKKIEQGLRDSEEKYRELAELLPDIIFETDNTLKLTYVNTVAFKKFGYSLEELKSGLNISKFIHPDYKEKALLYIKSIFEGKETKPNDYLLCKKDGGCFYARIHSRPIFKERNIIGIRGTITDINDMILAEQKLKESEERHRLISENANDMINVLNDRFEYEYLNEKVHKRILGYTKADLLGKNQLPLIHHEDRKKAVIATSKILRKGEGTHAVRFKHKNGTYKWLEITGKNFYDSSGSRKVLSIARDITDRKKAEEALKKSREKYRDLLETSSIGVMEIDVIKNQIRYINPKLLEIIGYTKEELTDADLLKKIIHSKDLSKLMETDEEMELEFRITDKKGKLKWVSGKRIPNFDDNKNLISTRLWLDDITEKKMYEELIFELNVNFLNFTTDIQNNIQLLLNTGIKLLNGDLILYAHKVKSEDQELFNIITSNNDSYTYNSKEFSEKLLINKYLKEGHDFPQTFINIDQGDYFNSDPFIKQVQAKGSFGKVIRTQEELDNIVCVFYKDNPIISGQDKLVLFLICDAIEIEQRRWQVQQDLKEQNITLNKINKLKTELFSRTSHELKTPLISIKGFTELLLTLHKSKLDPETLSILEEIKDGSKRLEKIINLLLESAKLEAGQLELKKVKEDLSFLINFCVKELKGLAILRNQSIFFDPNNKVEAVFDKERIYEVISNLLLNAVKYTPPGGQISIQIHSKDNDYIVSVTDNGIGFTEEEKKQVFKQFGKIERYGQGWDVAIEGTGLGLYISKRLVELHGGKIWLTSEGRNKGTTFHFSIPIIT